MLSPERGLTSAKLKPLSPRPLRAFTTPRFLGMLLPFSYLLAGNPGFEGGPACGGRFSIVGQAEPADRATKAPPVDRARMDCLTLIARVFCPDERTMRGVARALRTEAERELGPLTPMDRYWLGTSWWAYHQPAAHLKLPAWASRAAADPEIVFRHPEGGNCESSANAHAALLVQLGIPSRAVYGKLLPSGEGHVWTISDVAGRPLSADVHVARASEVERCGLSPWTPSRALIQVRADLPSAETFLSRHRPEAFALAGINP